MGKLNINLLKGIEEQENVIDRTKQEQEKSKDVQSVSQPVHKSKAHEKQSQAIKDSSKKENLQNPTNTKPTKAVMGFRAEVEKMEDWKLYASVTGQEIGVLCTNAIDEYINHHKLTVEQQQLFDLKKQALEAEKKIKSMIYS